MTFHCRGMARNGHANTTAFDARLRFIYFWRPHHAIAASALMRVPEKEMILDGHDAEARCFSSLRYAFHTASQRRHATTASLLSPHFMIFYYFDLLSYARRARMSDALMRRALMLSCAGKIYECIFCFFDEKNICSAMTRDTATGANRAQPARLHASFALPTHVS